MHYELCTMNYLKVEVVIRVVVADVLNHLTNALLFISCEWDETVLYVLAHEVAESAAEVLVTRVGEE